MIDQLTTKTVLRNVWGSRVTLSLQLTVGTCRSITTSCSGAVFVLWADILISITFENTGLHSNDMTSPSWSIGGISSGRSAEIVKQEKFKKCDTTWGGVWTKSPTPQVFLLPTSSSPLPPSPPFPLIPFLWPLYPSCNISSKNIPPVFCCAFHVYGKPTNFDLKFNESLLHWKNFQTITSSSTSSKVLQATFVVAKCRTQALVGHTKCMQEKHAYLVPFYPMKKKKMALYFNQKIFSVSHGNEQHHCYSQWAWFQSFIRSPNSSGSKSGTIGSVSRQSATASLSWHGLWIRFLLLARLTSVKCKQNRVLRSSRVHFFIATQIVLCPTIVPNWWTSFFENLRVKMSYHERHP